tara:strand:+ start:861 stop:2549 length:1689 start_codon:yes stop_codon:yes gene_type:complete
MSKDKELTTAEIRKLIRAHNVLMSIKIPPQTSREGILKILDDKGYMVNHIRKSIQRRYKNERKPNVTLKQADTILKKPEKTQSQIKMDVEKKKAKIEKQRVEKAKEIKLAKKEGVKEFKAGQKKGVKDSGRGKTKSEMKPKQPKSTNTKKALKKEDEVRPKEKVGKVKFDPKNVKVVGVKQKPITIGAKPKGGRIETGTLNKGKVVSGAKNKVKVDKRLPAIDYRLATFYGNKGQGGRKTIKNPTYKELIDTIGSKYGSLLKQPSQSQEDKIKSFLALDPSEYYRSPQTRPEGISISPPQYQPDKKPYVEIGMPYGKNEFSGKVKLLIKDPSVSDEKVGGGAVKKEDKNNENFIEFEEKVDKALEVNNKKLEELKPNALTKFKIIRASIKDGTEKRKISSVNISISAVKTTGSAVTQFGGTNMLIKFSSIDPSKRAEKATILPFEKVGGGAVKKEDKKSPFTDDEVKLINDLLHGAAQYKGGKTESGNPPKSVFKLFQDKNPISAKGTQKTNFKSALKLFLAEQNPSETDDEAIEGLDGTDRTFTKQMDKLGERLLKMRNWV